MSVQANQKPTNLQFLAAAGISYLFISAALPALIYALFSPHVPGDFTLPKYLQAAVTLFPFMLANLFQTVPLFPLAIILPRTSWYKGLTRKTKIAGWAVFIVVTIALGAVLGLRPGDGPLAIVSRLVALGLLLWVASGIARLFSLKKPKN